MYVRLQSYVYSTVVALRTHWCTHSFHKMYFIFFHSRSSSSLMSEDVMILDDYPQMEEEGLAIAFYVHSDGTTLSGSDLYKAVYESLSDVEMAIGLDILSIQLLKSDTDSSPWSMLVIGATVVCGVFVLCILICVIVFCLVIIW